MSGPTALNLGATVILTAKKCLSDLSEKIFPETAGKISKWAADNPQHAKIAAVASAILGCYFFVTAVKLVLPSISLGLSIAALSVAALCFNQVFNK